METFRDFLHGQLTTCEKAILCEHERIFSIRRSSLEVPGKQDVVQTKRQPAVVSSTKFFVSLPSSSACEEDSGGEDEGKAFALPGHVPHPQFQRSPRSAYVHSPPVDTPPLLGDRMGPEKSNKSNKSNRSDHRLGLGANQLAVLSALEMSRGTQSQLSGSSLPESLLSPGSQWRGAQNLASRLPSYALLSCEENKNQRLGELSEHSDYSMFQLHEAWTQQHASLVDKVAHRAQTFHHHMDHQARSSKKVRVDKPEATRRVSNASMLQAAIEAPLTCMERAVISPTSKVWVFWNVNYIAFLIYELIVNPLQAFDLGDSADTLRAMGLASIVFWTLDLGFVLSVGYITKSGQLERRRSRILARYAKSWLFPDLLLVVVDWTLILDDQLPATSFLRFLRVTKVVRYVRFIRALRFARLHRLPDFMQLLDDTFNSELLAVWKGITVNIFVLLLICHLVACTWYLVGKESGRGAQSWVEFYDVKPTSWDNQYFTSLHWSLSQMTPGSMDIMPQNVWERMFNCLVLIIGIIVFSSIISSITAGLTALKNIHGRYNRQRFMLRRFLRERCVSPVVTSRVLQYTDNILKPMQRMVRKSEVELLPCLPKSLYLDVILELYDSYLTVHPLFRALKEQNRLVLQKICCSALEQVLLSKEDVLFSPGESALSMYFVILGKIQYSRQDVEVVVYEAKTWVCEVALWTPWVHQGEMVALMDSELLSLHSGTFREVMAQHHGEMLLLKEYGTEFVYRLNEQVGFFGEGPKDKQETSLTDTVQIGSALSLAEQWCDQTRD